MRKSTIISILLPLMLVFLGACNLSAVIDKQVESTDTPQSPTPILTKEVQEITTDTPESPTPTVNSFNCVFDEIAPAVVDQQLVSLFGNSQMSQDIKIEAESAIRAYWMQGSKEEFLLTITNLDPNLLDKPERKTILESYLGPSSGCVDLTLLPGDYQLQIESVSGEWSIVINSIHYQK